MNMKDKKKLMIAVAFGLASTFSFGQSLDDIVLNVYKEVTCGCCVGWIQHMDKRGIPLMYFILPIFRQLRMSSGSSPNGAPVTPQ